MADLTVTFQGKKIVLKDKGGIESPPVLERWHCGNLELVHRSTVRPNDKGEYMAWLGGQWYSDSDPIGHGETVEKALEDLEKLCNAWIETLKFEGEE